MIYVKSWEAKVNKVYISGVGDTKWKRRVLETVITITCECKIRSRSSVRGINNIALGAWGRFLKSDPKPGR